MSLIFVPKSGAAAFVVVVVFLLLLQMSLPFWRISNHSDLVALHHALSLGYL
jgi:hypothetical protein